MSNNLFSYDSIMLYRIKQHKHNNYTTEIIFSPRQEHEHQQF